MISIVIVSHSPALAQAMVEAARTMAGDDLPPIAIAAGRRDGSFGTDPEVIAEAVTSVANREGILVMLDLHGAMFATELAMTLLTDVVADQVRITTAPVVEGFIEAVTHAQRGATLGQADYAALHAIKAPLVSEAREHVVEADATPVLTGPKAPPRRITYRTTVRNEHGIHIRPAAAIVTTVREFDADVELMNATTGQGPVPGTSLSRLTTLQIKQGHILQAKISGPEAELARDALADLAANDFGENIALPAPFTTFASSRSNASEITEQASEPSSERLCVVGPINLMTARPSTQGYRPGTPKKELRRFTRAAAAVSNYLAWLASCGSGIPSIIEAQNAMLADRELQHDIVSRITEGFSAVDAVDEVLSTQAHGFDVLADNYIRERGQDSRSLRRLLLLSLMGRQLDSSGPDKPSVWLVDELDAASAAGLDARLCLGVITINGGAYGHGVLSAKSRGIPVLAGLPFSEDLTEGRMVAFDPVTTELWVDPDPAIVKLVEQRNQARREGAIKALERAHMPAYTTSGKQIRVFTNAGALDNVRTGAARGAEGVGIVRTELLFSSWTQAPTAVEQAEVFLRMGAMIPGGPITIRTWDAGADKPLPFVQHMTEANPALGERGIRAMYRCQALFTEQIRAIVMASQQVPMRILLPMVTRPEEVDWARAILDEVCADLGLPQVPVGIMVEVPAAAIRAHDYADVVDFVSIGTNDLTQYVQAADRTNPAVRTLAKQDSRALMDIIAHTCRALPHIPVAVCGDIASDPGCTRSLLRMGVEELSVIPPMVPMIKQAVRMA